MKKIGLISNLYKDPAGEQTSKVLQGIIKRNMMPLVTDSVYKLLKQGKWSKEKDLFQHSDIILVLGGDGTILQTSRNAAKIRQTNFGY